MEKDLTSRFVQYEISQRVVCCDLGALLPKCFSRWFWHTRSDYITYLAFCMAAERIDDIVALHLYSHIIFNHVGVNVKFRQA